MAKDKPFYGLPFFKEGLIINISYLLIIVFIYIILIYVLKVPDAESLFYTIFYISFIPILILNVILFIIYMGQLFKEWEEFAEAKKSEMNKKQND